MCQLYETIKIVNGEPQALFFHQERMNNSVLAVYGKCNRIKLAEFLKEQEFPEKGIYKCKVIFDRKVREIEWVPYQRKIIKNLKMVHADHITYDHKFVDRSALEQLKSQHPAADELLLLRDGLVTDTTFTNLLFFDGQTWFTPEKPLLHGTKRKSLLDSGAISTAKISMDDVRKYILVTLINAMLDTGEICFSPSKIIFPD